MGVLTRMGIVCLSRGPARPAQSPAVLGVKPAYEDVDASGFLAFSLALLKTESCPTYLEMYMEWTLAHPLHDVDDIVEMADTVFGQEADGILTRDRNVFRHRVTIATTEQLFNKGREFIAVCRGDGYANRGWYHESVADKLLGYCWFDRGGYATYSNEEISNAKFHHVDLGLPVRTRVRLINEMIDQHILWAHTWGIPVICSTSIRAEHDGFMKIHAKRGFSVNGSYAWIRTEKAMELLNERQ